jgi:hypothetical protein
MLDSSNINEIYLGCGSNEGIIDIEIRSVKAIAVALYACMKPINNV